MAWYGLVMYCELVVAMVMRMEIVFMQCNVCVSPYMRPQRQTELGPKYQALNFKSSRLLQLLQSVGAETAEAAPAETVFFTRFRGQPRST